MYTAASELRGEHITRAPGTQPVTLCSAAGKEMQMWTLVVDRGVSFDSALDSLKAAHSSTATATNPVLARDGETEEDNAIADAGASPPSDAADGAARPWDTKKGYFGFWKVILLLGGVDG